MKMKVTKSVRKLVVVVGFAVVAGMIPTLASATPSTRSSGFYCFYSGSNRVPASSSTSGLSMRDAPSTALCERRLGAVLATDMSGYPF